jgi:hypothetical protein
LLGLDFFVATANYPSQETEEATRPLENVALTTKGLQERKTTIEWDGDGEMGKIINNSN